MTTKTLDWLNGNRFRAYPFINDSGLVYEGKRIPDSILLDCQIMDTRPGIGIPSLVFTKVDIRTDSTIVYFTYDGIALSCTLSGHTTATDDYLFGEKSFIKMSGVIPSGFPEQFVHLSLTFSSHEYIVDKAGLGVWEFTGKVLPTKILTVPASGVSSITTNGSKHIQVAGVATGDVHLVDGYRTQPIVTDGGITVRVGTTYGYDPCHYQEEELSGSSDSSYSSSDQDTENVCDNLMFFFCGQNAINSGNVVLQGGPGVNVIQGGSYVASKDILDSYGNIGIMRYEKVPCIEVVASSELLSIYRPSTDESEDPEEELRYFDIYINLKDSMPIPMTLRGDTGIVLSTEDPVYIDWGDGVVETISYNRSGMFIPAHTYRAAGEYKIRIKGVSLYGISAADKINPNLDRFPIFKPTYSDVGDNQLLITGMSMSSNMTDAVIGNRTFAQCVNLKLLDLKTGLTTINKHCLNGCSSLSYFVLPSTVTTIDEYAFARTSISMTVEFPSVATKIPQRVCALCGKLTDVIIGLNVTKIEALAFLACTSLKKVTCKAAVPPICEYNADGKSPFAFINSACQLYVPSDSIDLYRKAPVWKYFNEILSIAD